MTERKVVLVCGPPCSGKSTYVAQNRQPGDLVLDYDDIARRLGSPRTHGHDFKYHGPVQSVIDAACADIVAGKHQRAWVIRSLPRTYERVALAEQLSAELVVIDAPTDVLLDRARSRPNPKQTAAAIHQWRAVSGAEH